MYNFLLGLILTTMVVLVACSPQEQEAFTKKTALDQGNAQAATHHAVDPSQPLASSEVPASQL